MRRLHRFYLPSIPAEISFAISDPDLVHQLRSVLRYDIGEELIVFSNGSDDHVVQIDEIDKKQIIVHIVSTVPARPLPKRTLIAAVSIIKRDLFELIVQKLTELGVATIIPLISDRTVKQDVRLDRLNLISIEAVEQSGRNTLVDITEPIHLAECLSTYRFSSVVFDTKSADTAAFRDDTIVMYIGPEGGWGKEDMALFEKHAVQMRSLGPSVLRAETAAIVGAYELLQ